MTAERRSRESDKRNRQEAFYPHVTFSHNYAKCTSQAASSARRHKIESGGDGGWGGKKGKPKKDRLIKEAGISGHRCESLSRKMFGELKLPFHWASFVFYGQCKIRISRRGRRAGPSSKSMNVEELQFYYNSSVHAPKRCLASTNTQTRWQVDGRAFRPDSRS